MSLFQGVLIEGFHCRTSHNSHTNIRILNVKEMEERLRNLQQQKRKVTAKYQNLEEKMKKDIDIPLTEPEADIYC